MARTDDLTNFLNDVSAAIKSKLDDNTPIPAGQFDTKIMEIETVGNYQDKTVNVTQNGTQTITPDTSYDAIKQLTLNVSVPIASLQSKSYEFTTNQTITLLPDTGYDGFSSVNIAVNTTDPEYATNLTLSQQILGGSALPYIPLEYIESTGTQYIDTDYYVTSNNIRIDTKIYTASMPALPDNEQTIISNQDDSTGRFVLGLFDNTVFGYSRNASGKDNNVVSARYTGANMLTIIAEYNYTNSIKTLNVNNTITTATQNATISNSNSKALLFRNAPVPAGTNWFIGYLYYFKLYNNSVLVRDFIPVKRKSDNEVCLYDKVTNQFFTNQGTGSFIAGPEI